ncbi:hypothetical protein J5N97_003330 [Dioscorea zingiberensis]|uniref:Vacuolar import/degradation Vid27 C-terminal domain-containing protein n=1 Tax=Dioscorea zingiberensis TaxID=325984 RepID=A0A9D5D5C7_9LILI|nr:hypothetical protein J5N97_003330 [Dioscorea zingiberensis]
MGSSMSTRTASLRISTILEANDANKVRVFGNDFLGWAKPDAADDTIWEDAEEGFEKSPRAAAARGQDLLEEFEEDAGNCGGIQSLALGALDNSFLVSDSGVQVLKNFSHGVHGKGVSVKFSSGSKGVQYETPKKAVLMRGETNMLLMSPATTGKPQSTGVHQLDIETGKVVTEWKFEKDGTDITMRDITNDSKGAQLDPSESTFLGLDDNRLCRWDMRDRGGIVQNLANSMESPVLQWTQGHQFSRGTNFQCFASTGDGSIVVGSIDGKIRLYSKSSMRMAKTAFPGLGSPITHVDVTYDGRWILGTTDTYLILICTIFKDKDGKEKTGFSGRMGNRIAAPRLLKLTPLDSHLAGKNNKFQRGQFSWVTENGKQERHLVATVGKFSIIWNFQQVKNSRHECYLNQEGLKSCYCYKIVPQRSNPSWTVASCIEKFAATSDSPEAPLVVVTPMKLPLAGSAGGATPFPPNLWRAFVSANKLFADKVLEVANPDDDLVWAHDYHLMALPTFLRRRSPRIKLGFFLHSPFPSSEIFKTLPAREELLRALLNADLVGFHTSTTPATSSPAAPASSASTTPPTAAILAIEYYGRTVTVKIVPTGIHVSRLPLHRRGL